LEKAAKSQEATTSLAMVVSLLQFHVVDDHSLNPSIDWPAEGEKVPDDDPMDYYGHGTHVVGILAGKSGQ